MKKWKKSYNSRKLARKRFLIGLKRFLIANIVIWVLMLLGAE